MYEQLQEAAATKGITEEGAHFIFEKMYADYAKNGVIAGGVVDGSKLYAMGNTAVSVTDMAVLIVRVHSIQA